MENKLLILVALTSAGKDAIQTRLSKLGFAIGTSHTTRPMRDGEVEGREYFFIDDQVYDNMEANGEFAGLPRKYKTLVNNKPAIWKYGISYKEIESNGNMITIIDSKGALALKEDLIGKKDCTIIYIHVDEETRKERCKLRGDFDEFEWNRRESDDTYQFSHDNILRHADLIVENFDLNKCVCDIFKFISESED